MTTARHPAAKINVAWVIVFFIVGCAANTQRIYVVDGVNATFCPDPAVDITPLRSNSYSGSEVGGFTFDGCWGKIGKACLYGMTSILSGAVSNKSGFPGKSFSSFRGGSYIHDLIYMQGVLIEYHNGGRDLIFTDPNNKKQHYIWVRKNADHNLLDAEDELLAVCTEMPASLAPGYSCNRDLSVKNYHLSYTFFSDTKMPVNVGNLDKLLSELMDSWRCSIPKNRGGG